MQLTLYQNFYNLDQQEKLEEMDRGFGDMIKASANRVKKETNQKITLEDIQIVKRETVRILDRASIILQPEFMEVVFQ